MAAVSVVVPFFRTPLPLFEQCIKSICGQTFQDFELLLVDDGNTSTYLAQMETILPQDARIRILHQSNQGVSVARNHGIACASGTFLSFVDSDDELDPRFLEIMTDRMVDCDLAICGVAGQEYPVCEGICSREDLLSHPSLYSGLQYINFCWNKIYRTETLRKNELLFDSSMKLGEDALFLSQVLMHCNRISLCEEPLYHYVASETSAVASYRPEYWTWEKKVIESQWTMFHTFPLAENERIAATYWLYKKFEAVLDYYVHRAPCRDEARRYIQEMLKDPLFLLLSEQRKEIACFGVRDRVTLFLRRKLGYSGVALMN